MDSDYTVFVDESFYKWFGLPTKDSNLCYGALSMPTERLAVLDRFEASIRNFAFNELPAAIQSTRTAAEFKYTDFRHLTPAVIDELGKKLAYFLNRNDAWIYGFFIPAEGFMNYKIRSDFIDNLEGLKDLPAPEYQAQIEAIRQEMLTEWRDAEHNIGLLKECYTTFFNFLVEGHGRFLGKTFRVIYDSRNPEEDIALHAAAEDFAKMTEGVSPGGFAKYRGYSTDTSVRSAGLRLVDWIVGEVRSFFFRNSAITGAESSFDILSPYWNPKMLLIDGKAPFYRKELPDDAKQCFLQTGKGFMLPQIRTRFASGFLTHYAQRGEARHISVNDLVAYDMAD